MAQIFVLGMAVVDFVFAVDTLPDQAKKYRAKAAEIVGGGCAANAAVAIARLGGDACLATRLGDDATGEMILRDLKAEGVNTAMVQQSPGGRSSFSSVYVDSAGERQIMNFRGSGLTDETGWVRNAQPADVVLADSRWTAGALRAFELAKTWGVPGVLDAEAPLEQAVLEAASHVAFSRDGLLSLTGGGDPERALKEVASELPGWVCVTDGAQGVWYSGPSGILHEPAFPVDVKDTLAAGDIWHGAFALALAEGQGDVAAIRFANGAAALKCMAFGGRAACPARPELERFLKENTK